MSDNASRTVTASPVLRDCCAQSATCSLHIVHSCECVDAMFQRVTNTRMLIQVPHGEVDKMLEANALCCVVFPYQKSLFAFVDCIRFVRDDTAALEVQFAMPAVLNPTNMRRSFRVPVVLGAGIQLEMRLSDGKRISGDVLNLSETGCEVDLRGDDDRLPVNAEIQIKFQFRGESVEFAGTIRRRQQSRRGVEFSRSIPTQRDLRQQHAILQRMIRSLEQLWLKSRLVRKAETQNN